MLEPGLKARVTSKASIWSGATVYRWFFGRFFVSMGLVPIGRQSQGSTRTQRVPNHDAGLSPLDDDRMVACLIKSYARRKASERATRILRPSQSLRACHPYPTPFAKPQGLPPCHPKSDHRPAWTSHAVAALRWASRSGCDQGSTRSSRMVAFCQLRCIELFILPAELLFISVS